MDEFLNLRYEGTETALMVLRDKNQWNFVEKFHKLHQIEFGFKFENKSIIIDDIRVRATGMTNTRIEEYVDDQLDRIPSKVNISPPAIVQQVFFENKWLETPVYKLEDLSVGSVINGPAIIADGTQTNLITPNSNATVLASHLFIKIKKKSEKINKNDPDYIDPVFLSIFGHRFMDIAEQMGNQLRKTSVSTNVKERLDFSCALFDRDGNLVANAPHVPVHLGSMSTCIKMQSKLWEGRLSPGDSIVTNHPDVGGTHLPDITVITPAFAEGKINGKSEIIFYVASRAHHADIGGILPGSMPPNSRELYEEGAVIYSEKIVGNGLFDEGMVIKLAFTRGSC